MEKTKVAIVGMGTVGTGVAKLLLDHGDRTARHAGRTLWLEQVVVRDPKKPRDADLPKGVISNDLARITGDPEIKVVAQLIGGLEPARTIMLELLASGKDVVTANKALLAEHGPELFDRARELGRSIAFEAAVAGGIPIITNLSQCLSANQILSLRAILNGTSNYIVTQMDEFGTDYDVCLQEAQQLGYAESDPTLDVDGTDSAQKLAILAHLAFGARTHWNEIPRRGIDDLAQSDVRYAMQLGFRVKLLSVALLTDQGVQLEVAPMLVAVGTPLAEVRQNFNAISVVGDAVGKVFYHGQGAGKMPTASAVVADMIDTAVGRTAITFQTLKFWSNQESRQEMADPGNVRGRYYLRFDVADQPGVLARIAGVLGEHRISIASVYQPDISKAENDNSSVPLVIVTHETTEHLASAAVKKIEQLAILRRKGEKMRIIE